MRYWLPLGAKTAATRSLPHPENERRQNVNNVWSCICGNQCIARIFEHITELLTALIGKYTIYQKKITDSKIIDFATCETRKNKLQALLYAILISHHHHTAASRALYESIYGPAGRTADNPLNSDRFQDFHWTVPQSKVAVNRLPGLPIWPRFILDRDTDPKWRSGTVANASYQIFQNWFSDSNGENVQVVIK